MEHVRTTAQTAPNWRTSSLSDEDSDLYNVVGSLFQPAHKPSMRAVLTEYVRDDNVTGTKINLEELTATLRNDGHALTIKSGETEYQISGGNITVRKEQGGEFSDPWL